MISSVVTFSPLLGMNANTSSSVRESVTCFAMPPTWCREEGASSFVVDAKLHEQGVDLRVGQRRWLWLAALVVVDRLASRAKRHVKSGQGQEFLDQVIFLDDV